MYICIYVLEFAVVLTDFICTLCGFLGHPEPHEDEVSSTNKAG